MKTTDVIRSLFRLQPGETPLENAPSIQLTNGEHCIPQHYLLYHHTRASVENIVLDIDYDDRYPIFVCEEDNCLYVQIGIVGIDNYQPVETQPDLKVVYGRKWRVESQLPTSEIIQTIFLALKKAREHEIRELFRFYYKKGDGTGYTTPFNNHHDLPLMSQNAGLLTLTIQGDTSASDGQDPKSDYQRIEQALGALRYDGAQLTVKGLERRANGKWILDVTLHPAEGSQLPEITRSAQSPCEISLMLDSLDLNNLYYKLMDEFIDLSDRHVEEHFRYLGFPRFSRNNSILALADLSTVLRQRPGQGADSFTDIFKKSNYETDQTRVPKLAPGRLSDKIRSTLGRFANLKVALPTD